MNYALVQQKKKNQDGALTLAQEHNVISVKIHLKEN